jgi:hypothetical protein
MQLKRQKAQAGIGRYVSPYGKRSFVLQGDWSTPPKGPFPRIRRLMLDSMRQCQTTTLDFLRYFPTIEELEVRDGIVDFSGLYQLHQLSVLEIGYWVLPKHIRLDLSRFKTLRSLGFRWSHHVVGLDTLHRLTSLHLIYVYGVERLDLSPLRSLRRLDIGPAKGVRSLSLDGLRHLTRLQLAVMPRLTEVSGSDFYRTVTVLDIAGTHSLPREFLSSFTKLKMVTIGTKSTITAADFPRCQPKIFKSPV